MVPRVNVVDELYRALDSAPPHAVMPIVAAALQETIAATDVTLLLADYAEVTLERFESDRPRTPSGGMSVPIETAPPGGCYRRQEVTVDAADTGWSVCAPVTVRSERFGVLMLDVSEEPNAQVKAVTDQVACALAYVLASAKRYTDVFERVRRRRNLALAAEMQWELLPVLGYAAAEFSLAGAVEPAYDVGGDNFDYAVDGNELTLSITDAMGHGLRAALVSTLVVTAMRNCRRAGQGIVEQVGVANQVLGDQFGGEVFATSLIMAFDLSTGQGIAVNAGHPPSLLHRNNAIEPITLVPDLPLGLFAETSYRPQPMSLAPGDRLVLLTDGVVDAGATGPGALGVTRLASLIEHHRALPAGEFVRRVTRSILDHRKGELLDDATLLCLDWWGPQGERHDLGSANGIRSRGG